MKNKRTLQIIAAILLLCACTIYFFPLLTGRSLSQPEPTHEKIFNGVTYIRNVKQSPRNMVIHILIVDLKAEGIKFLVTPPEDKDAERPLAARTTTQFLNDFNLQIAVNGGGFTPWYSVGFLYFPHTGDRVAPEGFAASQGIIYADRELMEEEPTLFIYRSGKVTINHLNNKLYNAVSGLDTLILNGVPNDELFKTSIHPRTAVGTNKNGNKLFIVVVDGRQPGYSEGATLDDLIEIMQGLEAYNAINLDGGGSTTLVIRGEDGQPVQLNSPIHQRIPGHERPVGNHIGIYTNEK